jgi:diguanylate cyclase (GGDEF)-like protein/putative nucleotidyltransferase with HDIG domain
MLWLPFSSTERLWEQSPRLTWRVNTALAGFGGATMLVAALTTRAESPHYNIVLVSLSLWILFAAAQVLVVDPDRRHPRMELAALSLAMALCILTTWAAGGPHTPVGNMATSYIALIVVCAAAQLPVRLAVVFGLVYAGSRLLPLTYGGLDTSEATSALVSGLVIGTLAIGFVLVARVTVGRLEHDSAALRDRDAALRELATLVATDAPLAEIMSFATVTVTHVCGADGSCVLSAHSGRGTVVSAASRENDLLEGREFPIEAGSGFARVLARGEMVPSSPACGPVAAVGYDKIALAPICVRGRVWGALNATLRPGHEADEQLLVPLKACAELVGVAIANAEQSELLRHQATTDALTELLNHRVLHDRLVEDVARARRHGHPLSVAVFDIDHFKQVNDTMGHARGDELLRRIAHVMRDMSRTEDVLGRIGGDEFVVLMPDTGERDALRALDRMRRRITSETGQTVSIGVCGIEHAADADGLLRRADCALYWSKANGRNLATRFDPELMEDPSAAERAQVLQRSQALAGLRALAAAIDAKDPSTHRHSERVARLASQIAERLGWSPDRVALVHEAGLVHDVGKIGVPDAVLLKPARLDATEFAQIKAHAALGAQIVESVLTTEQVDWVRSHHERPDGRGYPDGLGAADLPEGAGIIAVADAFDAMTTQRPYGVLRTADEALAECEALAGQHFVSAPVAALASLLSEPVGAVSPRAPVAAPPA